MKVHSNYGGALIQLLLLFYQTKHWNLVYLLIICVYNCVNRSFVLKKHVTKKLFQTQLTIAGVGTHATA